MVWVQKTEKTSQNHYHVNIISKIFNIHVTLNRWWWTQLWRHYHCVKSVSIKYGSIVCCFNRVFSLSQDFHIEHMNSTVFQSRPGCVFLSFWKACAGFLRKTRGRWGINAGLFKKYCIVLENIFCNYVVIEYIPTQKSYSYAGGVLFIFLVFSFCL